MGAGTLPLIVRDSQAGLSRPGQSKQDNDLEIKSNLSLYICVA